jgi:hypothetical protein
VPASGSWAPSVAFAETAAARLPLGPPFGGMMLTTLYEASQRRRRDAVRTRYGPVSCFTPLRTRPLDHARGCPYPGPGRLLEPDLPWLADLSSLGLLCHRMFSFFIGARADGHTLSDDHSPSGDGEAVVPERHSMRPSR